MNYEVQVVGDSDLPGGLHHVIVERVDGPPLVFINGPVARSWRTARAYEAQREACQAPSVFAPAESHLQAV